MPGGRMSNGLGVVILLVVCIGAYLLFSGGLGSGGGDLAFPEVVDDSSQFVQEPVQEPSQPLNVPADEPTATAQPFTAPPASSSAGVRRTPLRWRQPQSDATTIRECARALSSQCHRVQDSAIYLMHVEA